MTDSNKSPATAPAPNHHVGRLTCVARRNSGVSLSIRPRYALRVVASSMQFPKHQHIQGVFRSRFNAPATPHRSPPLGDLCTTPFVREGAAALAPSPRGEGWGEGSSGQQSLGLRKGLRGGQPRAVCNASGRRPSFSLSLWERVGVRGLPVEVSRASNAASFPSTRREGWSER